MSSASVTSSKREAQEKLTTDLMAELDGVKALNSSLRAYLDHLRTFKKNLAAMSDNCKQLSKVNNQFMFSIMHTPDNSNEGCYRPDFFGFIRRLLTMRV
ncbi:hypothetical protein NE865_12594 [Phthorimaea operculella]|nr:hypothetical protein NE865_12594 [Phthorimaea operculella]